MTTQPNPPPAKPSEPPATGLTEPIRPGIYRTAGGEDATVWEVDEFHAYGSCLDEGERFTMRWDLDGKLFDVAEPACRLTRRISDLPLSDREHLALHALEEARAIIIAEYGKELYWTNNFTKGVEALAALTVKGGSDEP